MTLQNDFSKATPHNSRHPGLCRAACGGYALPEENDLVCGDYILRLRFVDWWNRHTASRTTRVLAG